MSNTPRDYMPPKEFYAPPGWIAREIRTASVDEEFHERTRYLSPEAKLTILHLWDTHLAAMANQI